ncbi:MAG: hypothetical protein DRJ03_15250 [Chloroflexi bacterium]|nr:MAG: hypothetical protein DRJ03_15250 [Chloroflexota bacterium]
MVRAAPRAKARKLRLPRWVGWAAGGAVALAAFFLILSRVPLRVQISGGQLEVVRVVEETVAPSGPAPSEVEGAEGPTERAATPQPPAIPTHVPGPTPPEEGKIVQSCDDQICVHNAVTGQVTQLTDDLDVEKISSSAWSPDGEQIVFSAGSAPGIADRKLYLINADGSDLRQLTFGEPDDGSPVWSPDGEWIAHMSWCDLWLIRPDGSDAHRLLGGIPDFCATAVSWSPDGQQIAFSGHGATLWVVNRDGSGSRKIYSFDQPIEWVEFTGWSPDGQRIACRYWDGSEHRAFFISSDGSGEPQVTEENEMPWSWFPNYWPQWSGEATLAPPINPTEQRGQLMNCDQDLCVQTADGSSVPLGLPASYTQFHGYTWSSDGSQIAFSACLLGSPGRCEELYVADLDNGAVVRLPRQGENHHPLVPAWSPNGEWIAYHDSGALSVVRPDGTGHREIVPHPYCPTNIAWSPDSSRLAWFAHWCDEEETSPALLLVVNFDGSDRRLLWTRDDASPFGSDVAFSPDGAYLAVRFDDGSVYRVDPECDPGPDGCDESSRTEMDDFPEHWLHSYWPQWAGEAAAAPMPIPSSPADQARAFAEPILAAIADRAPDYEDDFSTTDKGWGLDQFEITNGVARATLVDGNTAGLGPPWSVAKDFVLSFDSRQVSGSYGSGQTVNLGLPGGFLKFAIASGTRNWDSGKMWDDQLSTLRIKISTWHTM